ncbi:hypothetical protein H5410_014904 [Solanum commersonii]|uniref:Uncharacterized protein n=1 Tax=Solanum commersonii TaxID=4109 RepID=A0A9J5ZSC5_SOLCO|nr:hypothetical protein H5410_014904 [Solanum commersonii]
MGEIMHCVHLSERTKKRKPEDRLILSASHRMAIILPNVPVCIAQMEKIKSTVKRSCQQVTKRFCDAVPYRPKYKT